MGTPSKSVSCRRRSRFGATLNSNSLPFTYIAENDDEDERESVRRQSIPSSPASSIRSTRQSLNITHEVAQMLPSQVRAGIEQCVKLNVQNKINTTNAFNLAIIDYLMYIGRKGDMESNTLQVAMNALDVSAKVYSLRVDSLHHMVIGLSRDTRDQEDQISDENTYTNDDNNNVERTVDNILIAHRKKKKHHKLRTTIDALQGKAETLFLESAVINTDIQTTDMLLQISIPQHCGRGLQLGLYRDVMLDDPDVATTDGNFERIKWPMVHFDHRAVINPLSTDFQFFDWSQETEINDIQSISTMSLDELLKTDGDFVFDLYASFPDCHGLVAPNAHVEEPMITEESEIVCKNAPAVKQVEDIVDVDHSGVIDLIARGTPSNLEYSFLNESVRISSLGPTHWNVKFNRKIENPKVQVGVASSTRRTRKRELILEFDNESLDSACVAIAEKGKGRVQHQSWGANKLTSPENIQIAFVNMDRYFLRPDDVIEPLKPQQTNTTAVAAMMNEYDHDNLNDQGYCAAQRADHDGNHDMDVDENIPSNIDDRIFSTQSDHTFFGNTSTQRTESSFMGDNLTDMPKLIPTFKISHNRRAKRINMGRLKKAIWMKLMFIYNNTNKYIPPQIKFSDVYNELSAILPKKDTEDLSFHIASVALLQLANEKKLIISSIKSLNDYLICVP